MLPANQQQVIRKTFMEKQTQREDAAELGVSPTRVNQIQAAGIATLKDQLGKEPVG